MTLEVPGTIRIRFGVVAERRPGATPWAEHAWLAREVLEDAPALPSWTVLREEAGRTLFFAGLADVALHPTDTDNYIHNLQQEVPRIWVVLRPVEAEPGMALHCVTVDAGEAQNYGDSGADLLESLPLPAFLLEPVLAFVAQHHRDRTFHKRKRDRANPEPAGRRGP